MMKEGSASSFAKIGTKVVGNDLKGDEEKMGLNENGFKRRRMNLNM